MPVRSGPAHTILTTAGVCALLLLAGGCGLSSAQVDSPDPGPATVDPPAPAAAAPTTAAEAVAAAELAGIPPDGLPASLRVTVSPAAPGVPSLAVPGGLFSAVCGVPDDAARYATISITFTDRGPDRGKQLSRSSNLRADVTVEGGSGIGVFERSDAERSDDAARYCPGALRGGTSMQTEELSEAHQTMTLYAVAPAASATPDPFQGSTVRIDGLQVAENSISTRPWTWVVEAVTEGSACPDDPDALCVPLG